MSEKKNNNGLILIVVVLLIVGAPVALATVGILAAVAIPAYIRYIQKSKATEAEFMVERIADRIQSYHLDNCAFPPVLEPTSELPTGEKVVPNSPPGAGWDAIGFSIEDPSYFRYRTEQVGTNVTVIADADFRYGGPVHTVELTLSRPGETCLLDKSPAVTLNELE